MTPTRSPTPLNFLARALTHEAWGITPDALDGLRHTLDAGQAPTGDASRPGELSAATTFLPRLDVVGQRVAVVTLHGTVISRAPEWAETYGYVSPQAFARSVITAADDPSVTTIVLSCDSPGGTVSGTVEAAEAVAYARTRKPVVAVASDTMCSAAYWICSQATRIVVTPTAIVGSIGVITSHTDVSGYYSQLGVVVTYIRSAVRKALGQPTEKLTETALAERQALVDSIHAQFVAAVAAGRGKPAGTVTSRWATGQVWVGGEAVTAGLADRVASLSTVLAELTGNAAPPPDPTGPDPDDPEDDSEEDPTARARTSSAGGSVPPADPPPHSAQEAPRMNIHAITVKLQQGEPLTAEEGTFLAAHLGQAEPQATDTTPAPAAQDTSAWPAEARAAFESMNARLNATENRATAAEQAAAAERDIRLKGHFEARAVTLGQPVAFAATLRAAHDKLSPDEYDAYENALKVGAQAVSGLLQERGTATAQASGDVYAELGTRAKTLMAADARLTLADAQKQVMATDPAFAHRYHAALRH
ncbi:S49 family peptidase [Deinococcus aquiradiocola]|uniref:Peptidase S49 domain-containing protein n=1 Tax=Deinococcus aquiradiocola TaxID=393059 RepID=A0A917P7B3_9DEIO|nr:S49 family peptidase [Deinococcus aquiradiocola]GGJ65297.1 hypothetical protein GCM10008939_06510 [Deinococcus aquiradiocola]